MIIHTLPSEAGRKYGDSLPGTISSSVATNSNGLSTLIIGAAVTGLKGVVVTGLPNGNVGSTSIDGSTVAVGAKVGIVGAAVAGGEVEVLGMLWGAQAAKSVIPNKRNMNL